MNKEILKLIEKLWEKYPNQRFGQLLTNHVFDKDKIFYQEDEETIKKIKKEI